MGTRNLTVVMSGGEHKVAQYGQWDGYPDSQGMAILNFCRKRLTTEEGRRSFAEKLKTCRFVSPEEHAAFVRSLSPDGSLNMEQASVYHATYPMFNRDHGAKVLEMIDGADGPVELRDQYDFAADSLFCEWCYVIDIDNRKLEVYKGFNHRPLGDGERFRNFPGAKEKLDDNGKNGGGPYHPVRFVVAFDLDSLPADEEFLKAATPEEE